MAPAAEWRYMAQGRLAEPLRVAKGMAAGLFPYPSFEVIAAPTRLQIAVIQASNPQQMLLQCWHQVLGPRSHCSFGFTVRATQWRVFSSS